jgi:phytoene dehydrogenase-like protein
MAQKVIIAGAGIAGLAAGCYLQMNGFDTEIYEMHTLPGGLCTSWKKQDYWIDGCIHWLVGSNPSDPFYKLWNELIDMKSLSFFDSDEYIRVEDDKGNAICVFSDIGRTEAEFLEKAPEDKDLILELTAAARKISRLILPVEKPAELFSAGEMLKFMFNVLPYLGTMRKWSRITLSGYAARFKNPLLAHTIEVMFVPEMSALFMLFTMAWFQRRSAGYPIGGSLKFARHIEKKYLALGGKLHYGKKVDEILTRPEGKKQVAYGVKLLDGNSITGDIVISTADGYDTIFRMLGGKFLDKYWRRIYSEYPAFDSYIQVSLGVARKFEPLPMTYIPLPEVITVDPGTTADFIGFRIHHFDPMLAPEGKTLITSSFSTSNYHYWSDLRSGNPKLYKAEKRRLAQVVIDALELRLGNIASNVEMEDVSTPATVIRYTNNWKGSFEGWVLTPENALKQMKKQLPGLQKFYMAGHWVEPGGGLPAALMSGRNVAQIICKHEGKEFDIK